MKYSEDIQVILVYNDCVYESNQNISSDYFWVKELQMIFISYYFFPYYQQLIALIGEIVQ